VTQDAWAAFLRAREHYRRRLAQFGRSFRGLKALQQGLADRRSGPAYTVRRALVYNQALDDLERGDEIRLILVGDNPGRREQECGRYLVGPSGKIAEAFFRAAPEPRIDFRRHVLILNKTPVHSPRTLELRELCRAGGPALSDRVAQTQRFMASLLLEFQRALSGPRRPVAVWITGYSEMKRGGLFWPYTEALGELYAGDPLREHLFLYRHFSMNQFTVDLRRQSLPGESLQAALDRVGRAHRRRILGW
jgi:hypothetical protein